MQQDKEEKTIRPFSVIPIHSSYIQQFLNWAIVLALLN
jgi:hypothetical protein